MAQGPVFIKEAVLCIQRDSFPDSKTVFQTNNPNRFSHFPFKGQKRNFSGVSNLAESCHKSNWEANLVQIVFTQAINFKSPLPLPLQAVSCKLAFVLLLLGDCVCVHSNIFSKSYPHPDFWKLSVCCCTSPSEEKTSCRAYAGPLWARSSGSLGKETGQGPQQKKLRLSVQTPQYSQLRIHFPNGSIKQKHPYSRNSAGERQRARRMCWSRGVPLTHPCSREQDRHLPCFSLVRETSLCNGVDNAEGRRVGNHSHFVHSRSRSDGFISELCQGTPLVHASAFLPATQKAASGPLGKEREVPSLLSKFEMCLNQIFPFFWPRMVTSVRVEPISQSRDLDERRDRTNVDFPALGCSFTQPLSPFFLSNFHSSF